jgi:hypothetical protein
VSIPTLDPAPSGNGATAPLRHVGRPRRIAAVAERLAYPPCPRTSPSSLDGCASGQGGYTAKHYRRHIRTRLS